jgi:hypothetical protein
MFTTMRNKCLDIVFDITRAEYREIKRRVSIMAAAHGTSVYLKRLRRYSRRIAAHFADISHQDMISTWKEQYPEEPALSVKYTQLVEDKFMELMFERLLTPHPITKQIKLFEIREWAHRRSSSNDASIFGIAIPARGKHKHVRDELDPSQEGAVDKLEKAQERWEDDKQ